MEAIRGLATVTRGLALAPDLIGILFRFIVRSRFVLQMDAGDPVMVLFNKNCRILSRRAKIVAHVKIEPVGR